MKREKTARGLGLGLAALILSLEGAIIASRSSATWPVFVTVHRAQTPVCGQGQCPGQVCCQNGSQQWCCGSGTSCTYDPPGCR